MMNSEPLSDERLTEIEDAISEQYEVADIFAELRRLRAREAALVEIARDVAHTPPAYREQPEEWYCIHCGANFIPALGRGNQYDEAVAYRALRHSAACAVTKARALLSVQPES